ncbi:unnamed protein product [Rotaria sordida]|uniref:Uncharacterized protein n=1 Tax=Rotaria sordida TaxID=392033 RepID=A0A819VRW2_9BILA|nr:unnamed protein product [Rotaria sordida]
MENFTIEIDTDSDDHLIDVRQLLGSDDLRVGLDAYEPLDNLQEVYWPIRHAKVGQLYSGDSGRKTHWLFAEICPCHLGKGEPTSNNTLLSGKIRSRGKLGDDCGHIIACSLGGKMVEFNLFPQQKYINRGWKGWNQHWRIGIEYTIWIWLINPFRIKPSVEFQVRFFYNDQTYRDRPDHGKFLIKFKCDGYEKNKKVDNRDKKEISMELYTILKGDLMNTIENESDSVPEPNYEKFTTARVSKFHDLTSEQFQHFILLLLNDYKANEQQHVEPTSASSGYRPTTTPLTYK